MTRYAYDLEEDELSLPNPYQTGQEAYEQATRQQATLADLLRPGATLVFPERAQETEEETYEPYPQGELPPVPLPPEPPAAEPLAWPQTPPVTQQPARASLRDLLPRAVRIERASGQRSTAPPRSPAPMDVSRQRYYQYVKRVLESAQMERNEERRLNYLMRSVPTITVPAAAIQKLRELTALGRDWHKLPLGDPRRDEYWLRDPWRALLDRIQYASQRWQTGQADDRDFTVEALPDGGVRMTPDVLLQYIDDLLERLNRTDNAELWAREVTELGDFLRMVPQMPPEVRQMYRRLEEVVQQRKQKEAAGLLGGIRDWLLTVAKNALIVPPTIASDAASFLSRIGYGVTGWKGLHTAAERLATAGEIMREEAAPPEYAREGGLGMVFGAGSAIGQVAGQLPAGALAGTVSRLGNVGGLIGTVFFQEAAEAATNAARALEERGVPPRKANNAAALIGSGVGAINAWLERFSGAADVLRDSTLRIGLRDILTHAAETAIEEGTTEAAQQATQEVARLFYERGAANRIDESVLSVLLSGLYGAIGGGFIGGGESAIETFADAYAYWRAALKEEQERQPEEDILLPDRRRPPTPPTPPPKPPTTPQQPSGAPTSEQSVQPQRPPTPPPTTPGQTSAVTTPQQPVQQEIQAQSTPTPPPPETPPTPPTPPTETPPPKGVSPKAWQNLTTRVTEAIATAAESDTGMAVVGRLQIERAYWPDTKEPFLHVTVPAAAADWLPSEGQIVQVKDPQTDRIYAAYPLTAADALAKSVLNRYAEIGKVLVGDGFRKERSTPALKRAATVALLADALRQTPTPQAPQPPTPEPAPTPPPPTETLTAPTPTPEPAPIPEITPTPTETATTEIPLTPTPTGGQYAEGTGRAPEERSPQEGPQGRPSEPVRVRDHDETRLETPPPAAKPRPETPAEGITPVPPQEQPPAQQPQAPPAAGQAEDQAAVLRREAEDRAPKYAELLPTIARKTIAAGRPLTDNEIAEHGRKVGLEFTGAWSNPSHLADVREAALAYTLANDPSLSTILKTDADGPDAVSNLQHGYRVLAHEEQKLFPRGTLRSERQIEHGQFSTHPAVALALVQMARIGPDDVVLEPSAGTGILAAVAKARGARVVVNEYDPQRYALLKAIFPDAMLGDALDVPGKIASSNLPAPTVVLMNPPFSAAASVGRGRKLLSEGARHIRAALVANKAGIIPVFALVSEGYDPRTEHFQNTIGRYTGELADVYYDAVLEPDVAASRGTPFRTRLQIYVPKGATPSGALQEHVLKSWYDVATEVARLANDNVLQQIRTDAKKLARGESAQRPAPLGSPPGQQGAGGQLGTGGTANRPVTTGTPPVSPPRPVRGRPRTGGGDITGGVGTSYPPSDVQLPAGSEHQGPAERPSVPGQPGSPAGESGVSWAVEHGRPGGGREGSTPTAPGPVGGERPGAGESPPASGPGAGQVSVAEPGGMGVAHDTGVVSSVSATPVQRQGRSASDLVPLPVNPDVARTYGATKAPQPIVQSQIMAASRKATVPLRRLDKLRTQGLYDYQLETVLRVLDAMDHPPHGFLLAAGTGTGKLRMALAVLLERQPHCPRQLYVTYNMRAAPDIQRDFTEIGGNVADIILVNEARRNETIPNRNGILVCSYHLLNTRLAQILEWMSGGQVDYHQVNVLLAGLAKGAPHEVAEIAAVFQRINTTLIFDEAHKAKGGRDTKAGENTLRLQEIFPNAGTLFLSATPSTEVGELGYAMRRLGLIGPSMPLSTPAGLAEAMEGVGTPGIERLTQSIAGDGRMDAYQLGAKDVQVIADTVALTDEEKATFDRIGDLLRDIREAMLRRWFQMGENRKKLGTIRSEFVQLCQAITGAYLTGIKIRRIVERIKADIAAGRAPIIAIASTHEAWQQEQIKQGVSPEEVDLSLYPRIMRAINNMWVSTETIPGRYGEPTVERPDPASEATLAQVLRELRIEAALTQSDMAESAATPLTQLERELEAAGISFAEISGRTGRHLFSSTGVPRYEQRNPGRANPAELRRFREGKADVLIFTLEAGGIGESYHADPRWPNTKQRSLYMMELGWKAISAVQALGRVHRANQVVPPRITLVSTNDPAEKRQLAGVTEAMRRLGAQVHASAETEGLMQRTGELPDLLGPLGEFALSMTLSHLEENDRRTYQWYLDKLCGTDDAGRISDPKYVLNHLPLLSFEEREQFLDAWLQNTSVAADNFMARDAQMDNARIIAEYVSPLSRSPEDQLRMVVIKGVRQNTPLTFEQVNRGALGYLINESHGDVLAIYHRTVQKSPTGKTEIYYVIRPNQPRPVGIARTSPRYRDYIEVTRDYQSGIAMARRLWDAIVSRTPPREPVTLHVVTGHIVHDIDNLSPLAAFGQWRRILLEDGRVVLGIVVLPENMATVREKLGLKRTSKDAIFSFLQEHRSAEQLIDFIDSLGRVPLTPDLIITPTVVSGRSHYAVSARLGSADKELLARLNPEAYGGTLVRRGNKGWQIVWSADDKNTPENLLKFCRQWAKPTDSGSRQAGQREPEARPVATEDAEATMPPAQLPELASDWREDAERLAEELNRLAAGKRRAGEYFLPHHGTLVYLAGGIKETARFAVIVPCLASEAQDIQRRAKELNIPVGEEASQANDPLRTLLVSGRWDPRAPEKSRETIARIFRFIQSLQASYYIPMLARMGGQPESTYDFGACNMRAMADATSGNVDVIIERKPDTSADDWQAIGDAVRQYLSQWLHAQGDTETAYRLTVPNGSVTDASNALFQMEAHLEQQAANGKPPRAFRRGAAAPEMFLWPFYLVRWLWRMLRRAVTGSEPPPVEKFRFRRDEVEERFRAAYGMKPPSIIQRLLDGVAYIGRQVTRIFPDIPHTAEYAVAIAELTRMRQHRGIAAQLATDWISHVLGLDTKTPLSREHLDLFTRIVVMEDLAETINYARAQGETRQTLPFGFTDTEVAEELSRLRAIAQAEEYAPVRQALERRAQMWETVRPAYIAALNALGIPTARLFWRKNYFRHIVLAYQRARREPGFGGRAGKMPGFRSWRQRRHLNALDYNTHYLQAEYEVLSQMLLDTAIAESLQRIVGAYNLRPELEQKAAELRAMTGREDIPWTSLIPDDYTLTTISDALPLHQVFTLPRTLVESAVEQNLAELKVPVDKVRSAIAMHQKDKIVLPKGIVKTLAHFWSSPATGFARTMSELSAGVHGILKRFYLLGPHRVAQYFIRNISGDFDAVLAFCPQSLAEWPTALSELVDYWRTGRGTDMLREWIRHGGFQQTQQVVELPSIHDIARFRKLGVGPQKPLLVRIWRRYWEEMARLNNFREAIMRYAAFRFYRKAIQKYGTVQEMAKHIGWGAAQPEMVWPLPTMQEQAALLADSALGAYDRTGNANQVLRRHVFIFSSFQEANLRRYLRGIANCFRSDIAGAAGMTVAQRLGIAARIGAVGTLRLGLFAVKAAILTAFLRALARLLWPDEEKELPEDVRSNNHLILGRDADGNIRYISRLGSLDDLLSWLELDKADQHVSDFVNGRRPLGDIARDIALAPVNKVLNQLSPVITVMPQAITRTRWYPHPAQAMLGVEQLPQIHDAVLEAMRNVGLEDEYRWLTRQRVGLKPLPRRRTQDVLLDLISKGANPDEAAYQLVQERKRRFLERNKMTTGFGWSNSARTEALYWLRQSLRHGDTETALYYLNDYVAAGGTRDGLETSLRNMHPLFGIPAPLRQQFMQEIRREDGASVDAAVRYWQNEIADLRKALTELRNKAAKNN